jgi:hypothetical protein
MNNEKAHITIDATAIPLHLYPQTPPGLNKEELERRRARIADQLAAFARESEAMFAQEQATRDRIGGLKTTTLGDDVEVEYHVFHEDVCVVLDSKNAMDVIIMGPQEALSLLAWLQQEKPTLEQWAKEQEA